MEKNYKDYLKIYLRFLLIPLMLFILWFGLSLFYIISFDTSLTILSYNYEKEHFNTITYDKLLKGDKISGTFTAIEDNLGIVSVRFRTYVRPPYKDEDILVFRLKEVGAKDWYYENNYRVGLIYDVPFFPFGFPKLSDSQGKTYYFEIESLKGDQNNSVAINDRGQILFIKYQADKKVLLEDKKELGSFAVRKLISALLTTDVKFSSFIYFLPFLFYIFWIISLGQSQKKRIATIFHRYIVTKFYFITLGVVFIDIFLIQLTNEIVYLVIPFLWIATLRVNKITSTMTFFVALSMLLIAPLFLLLKDPQTAEKGAAWAYIFLIAGLIQIIYELKNEQKKDKNLPSSLKKIRTKN